ncbi:thiol reductant ABC exporter subunit CydC [Geodermatophilus obscurus]|uniref:ABC transporter, CydDC cysteine exporter (CydDC-E) family, permease/ATP-binding protein CydC n=1 Tax=Geodermatophilus obscurus (strain ATCC 25078 / DSM 43160 / JCM 3152 / CCUG 61914 / KCC A-0152 / KCTC 9177 / NBRC 13315 / NRRL B-3577 / G-20) TaxID=526225 RepID=D2SBU1_GEOOG|nr:thiol reductant ABC exporter subunit CydC [Geodermatophilus obscurus]ADB76198.1 ABC transporter, CydDC cysteine exporter (CydDC- E) family, permease/ATP-binding protein CydC [Geodermatophilus obscurus DSM 43160]
MRSDRGPLGALAGVPGVTGALVRAAVAALGQVAGLVLLAAGLAHAVARAADQADGALTGPLLAASAGVVLRALAGWAGEVVATRDARRAEEQLRAALTARLAASPAAVAAAGGPGPAALLATTRLAELGPALATRLPALAQALVVPPVLLVVLARTDLLSAGLVAVTLPLVPLFMVLVGLTTRDGTTAAARALDRIAAHVAELVRGLPVLVGLGRAAEQAAALAELGEASRRRTLSVLRLAFLSALVLELLATLSVALVAVTVGLRLVHGDLDLAVGLTALLLAPEAFAPLRALGAAHHAGEDAALAAAEARAVLAAPDAAPAVEVDEDDPRGADVAVGRLSVRYPGRTVPALPPVDLAVRPGELVALRGASGSGKSTLLAVLAGLTDPAAEVRGTVSGVPAGGVAYVPQHPRTTGATVADELRRHAGSGPGGSRDTVDEGVGEALVVEALARAGAAELAGRDCTTLSPGELQRVALARALVRVRRGARLLLLDEPTAHLDDAAAARVAAVLAGLHGTVSTLLVTHDRGLAALADRTADLPSPAAAPHPVASATSSWPSAPDRHEIVTPAAGPGPAGATNTGPGLRWPRRALVRAVAAGTASAGAGVALTAVSGWLIVRAAEMPPVLTLLVAIVGVRAFGLGRAGLRWVERMTAHDAALRLAADLRVRVWRALAAQGLAADRTPGSALARVVGDVGLVQDLSVRVVPPALAAGTVTTATVGALALVSPAAAGAAAAVLAATVALVLLAHGRVDAGAARAEAALRVAALRDTTTALDGAADLRAHGLAGRTAADLAGLAADRSAADRARTRAGALGAGAVVLGTGLAAVAAAAAGAAAGVTGPAIAVLALAPLALAEPLAGLVTALQRRGTLADARDRLDAVLTAPVPADPADPRPAPARVRSLATDGLVAGWPGGPDVLRGLTTRTDVEGGWLVVRGPSGSGKSTFLAVLLAALRPRAGGYALDGVPADRLTGDGVRSRIAWLPQEAHVFASSIRANLALAAPRGELAGPDGEARMRAALAATGLGGLLAGLPGGLDTPVGAGGTALSGGERRRLAAARALLADRDVVLLDEPTAHLDPPTAAALLRDLRAALAGRVVVCVTHDDTVERPGDTVVRLGEPVPALAG